MYDETQDEASSSTTPDGVRPRSSDDIVFHGGCTPVVPERVPVGKPRDDRPENEDWGQNLTPLPLSQRERDGLRALGAAMREPQRLPHAIRRYEAIRDTQGLGTGMDPDLALGLRVALEMLVLRYATRFAADIIDASNKRRCLVRHVSFAAGHVGAVLRLCMAQDRELMSGRRKLGS